jgi:hypothetical protein
MSEQSAIEQLDLEIADEEQHLIRIVDRIDAMGELRHAAADVQKTLDRPVTFEDLFTACKTPRDRAKLFSLFDRIAPPDRTGPSGLADREIGGHHLQSALLPKSMGGKVLS